MRPIVHLLVPGSLEQVTGGFRYDRRVVDGLRAKGRQVVVHELAGRFPVADAAGAAALQRAARACHGGAIVVVDSLCLGAAAELLPRLRDRCACLALVHHPASMETGLPAGVRAGLRRAERAALGAVHRVITTSPATARLLTGSFGVPTTAVDVAIPGGDRRRPTARRSGAPAWRLVSVGTISARKDHLTLVRALAQITDLRWSLDCHGSLDRDQATARRVAAEIGRLGLKSRVRLRGETGDAALEKAYAQADLLLLASRFEGYGMVLGEALARGVPVVATDIGPARGIVPRDAGILVRPGNVSGFAWAIRAALRHPARYRRLVAGARRAAVRLPGWDRTVAQVAAALDCAES